MIQNKIPRNWQKVKLGEIAEVSTGSTDTKDAVENGDYPLFDRSSEVKRSDKNLFDGTAIILPGEGKDFMPRFFVGKFDLHQRAYAIFPDEAVVDAKYLYYSIMKNRLLLSQWAVGSTVRSLRMPIIKALPLMLPSLREQKRVSFVLFALDDKIEVNNKIAKTLEEMAQALFKEWFVRFKFPGYEKAEFEDSEHGKIPKGWEVKRWKELEGESYAGDWGDEKQNEEATENVYILRGTDIPALKSGSKGDCPIRFLSKESLEKRKLKPGDIVIEISGGSKGQPTGRSIFITEKILERFEYPLVHTSFCRLVRANNILDSIFVYLHLDRLYRSKAIWNYQLQSTGISNFQYGHFRESEYLVVPSMGVQKDLAGLLRKCVEYGQSNENQKLAALRDLLLPKLMKGEIRV